MSSEISSATIEPSPTTPTSLIKQLPKPPNTSNTRWFLCWLNWSYVASSVTMLRAAEKKILSYLKTTHRSFYVDIGPTVGESDKIWTISMNTESPRTPLVLLHGMGAGIGFWVLNLDSLAQNRPVYAIDILGFGRSSRPAFASDASVAEHQFVKSIEEWRREMNIQKMILLGHSMGGYLATSYTMTHPDRVNHLILADPWGFQEKPKEIKAPLWVRAIARVLTPMNPLWVMRAAGPYGQWVVEKTRPDIIRKFSEVIESETPNENIIAQYIHQCNAQSPTGESAFHAMMTGLGWAKNPMLLRMNDLRADKPLTLLYGSRSWIDQSSWDILKEKRNSVRVQPINGAGHHVFADKPDLFNEYVNEACAINDEAELLLNKTPKVNVAANTAGSGGTAAAVSDTSPVSNQNIINDGDKVTPVIVPSVDSTNNS